MSKTNQISLFAAIFMNVNIMLSTGAVVNTAILAQRTGILGSLCYLIAALFMLPLILTFAELLDIHPGGNLYTFGSKQLNKLSGFMNAWVYSVGKLASVSLMIHVVSSFIQVLIPALGSIPTIFIDAIIIGLYTFLNMFGIQTGKQIQLIFLSIKISFVSFIILLGLTFFNSGNLAPNYWIWSGIPYTIPLVAYTFTGFAVACSISQHIKNPKKNAPLAILISFGIVVLLTTLYQMMFFAASGPQLFNVTNYTQIFPILLNSTIGTGTQLSAYTLKFLNITVASASLGGAYGLMFANTWNFHSLAINDHLIFSSMFKKLNRFHIPAACLIIQAIICLIFLYTGGNNQIPFQQTATFASVFAYTLSAIALIRYRMKSKKNIILPGLGFLSSITLLVFTFKNFFETEMLGLIWLSVIILFGLIMYFIKQPKN
ncbi:MAG: hypothetical protein UR26_C0001G0178 [candidate division TM6 bacterium GW2011_GWF2_32_72]|nr:MAG: hypothetical protein UR26_C0001G0178 [candidate division TM6 bacterium GW2011_GWF2_32_72]